VNDRRGRVRLSRKYGQNRSLTSKTPWGSVERRAPSGSAPGHEQPRRTDGGGGDAGLALRHRTAVGMKERPTRSRVGRTAAAGPGPRRGTKAHGRIGCRASATERGITDSSVEQRLEVGVGHIEAIAQAPAWTSTSVSPGTTGSSSLPPPALTSVRTGRQEQDTNATNPGSLRTGHDVSMRSRENMSASSHPPGWWWLRLLPASCPVQQARETAGFGRLGNAPARREGWPGAS
jgi:hypothetical protein